MPFILEWTREFARELPPEVCLAGPDLGGPLNTAKDLFDTNLLFTALYDDPRAFQAFLALAAEVQASCYREVIAAAGGLERLTCIDFDPAVGPGGPQGLRLGRRVRGPVPRAFRPVQPAVQQPHLPGMARRAAAQLRAASGRRALPGARPADQRAELLVPLHPRRAAAAAGGLPRDGGSWSSCSTTGRSAGQIVRGFEEAAAALVPEVVAIPVVWLNQAWSDGDIRALYEDLRGVAGRAAREMRWRAEA